MSGEFAGGCLCGAVRFRIDGAFEGFFLCHCSRCRRATGSAHAANLFSGTGQITWESGDTLRRAFRLDGTRFERCFCATCGGALPVVRPEGGLVVPAGCLEGPVGLRPGAHICWQSRADWDDALEELARLDGLPG
ncbi:GFA family protein [Marinibacterium profundimaris]|uniref:Aldehyde-activating protein n=1 Tax=Marinibacterium profundimaris TaxID=1679460 RepID=A0A225NL63_9RHOB|nr:GFA family protein [Marinibacterium profundimaris]OWU73040.1 aldehyde-activating protein [Marinibacterium profundimaris]